MDPSIAIVGGSGFLGTELTSALINRGYKTRVVDLVEPRTTPDAEYVRADAATEDLSIALAGCAAVVILAGLHAIHLMDGTPSAQIWTTNLQIVDNVIRAAVDAQSERLVFASSTSVYGPGSMPGELAQILDEEAPVFPQDAYDYSKLLCEQVVLRQSSVRPIVLRLGRFSDSFLLQHEIRKISTGLDVRDGAEAIRLIVSADVLPRPLYCVASDLDLTLDERRSLGKSAVSVLDHRFPGLSEFLKERGLPLPARVGKSVSSSRMRRDFGYEPRYSLMSWKERLLGPDDAPLIMKG